MSVDVLTSQGEVPSDAHPIAGGTDLSERLRSGVSRGRVADITRLRGLTGIEATEDAGISIGALVRLADLGEHPEISLRYGALAKPVRTLATPQIRTAATLGGSLCQHTRCWYYRNPQFSCYRSGGSSCPARDGNNLYGVAFDLGACAYPSPSSTALGLMAYDATVRTSARSGLTIPELLGDGSDPTRHHLLEPGELLTHVSLPPARADERTAYFRLMSRKWAEWPLVECVVRLQLRDEAIALARVCMGGVANVPLRAEEVESALLGRAPTAHVLEEAAALSTRGADPPAQTRYKLPMIVASVLEALERALAPV